MPGLVLFTQGTTTGCGFAEATSSPLYCVLDQKIYADPALLDTLRAKSPAGDFAFAFLIARQVGLHVENQLGVLPRVQARQAELEKAERDRLSIRIELMADCLAGVWVHHSIPALRPMQQSQANGVIGAANSGPDGYAPPDSSTHGTVEQRAQWFLKGVATGQLKECDTFRQITP